MMTQREQRVMDLHHRGFRNGEIALLLDMKPYMVGTIVSRYGNGDGGFEDGIRAGSAALLAAVQQVQA